MNKQKKLPQGIPIDAIERVYTKELDRYSDELINEIKSFLKTPLKEDVIEGSVEIFPDEYGDGVLSIGLYLRAELTEHIPFLDKVKDLPMIDLTGYEEENLVDLIVDITQRWFAESWWKAGGWEFKLPLTVYGHDGFGSGTAINLTKQ
ncbi:MAG: hypothetical protein HEP71_07305 [Roseivirga sp.]|nr:hypothetical protein [Roseivirga sp.]